MRPAKSVSPALGALLLAAFALAPDTAFAGSAYAAGLRQAHRRGIAKAACYAGVFETYASLNRFGHWSVRRSRSRDNGFQLEMFSKCRISA